MRRMNSMFHGHHGASARTPTHVALDRLAGRRVVPRQRQVHDPRRATVGAADVAEVVLGRRDERATPGSTVSSPAVDLDQQRADAGGDVDDPVGRCSATHRSRSVDADPQREVERHRAVLDEQEPVAGPAVGDARVVAVGSTPARGRRRRRSRPCRPRRCAERCRFHGGRATGSIGRVARASHPRRCCVGAWPRRAATARRTARGRPGASWPSFHRSPLATTAGHTKPPRLGPSGPRMIGMSPVRSTAPMA